MQRKGMSRSAFHRYAAERAEAEGSLPPGDARALTYLESIGQERLPGLGPASETEKSSRLIRAEKAQGSLF